MNYTPDSEPAPVITSDVEIVPLVMEDIHKRYELGLKRYGVSVRKNNGRKALIDMYEEMLDAVIYLRQHLEETQEE